ncbi:FMN-binding protein [Tepidibacillus marianensis]|uniref:FMN-binding protein n=1 Tax=Tepidibacillus marianensis TaxID=3131995 RepID=UPI0030D39201
MTNKKYQDGTYYGKGRNRIGSVEVAVTIKSDKITDVQITKCTTSYPKAYIDHLPTQVIARQNENVDIVSGATRSSEDFMNAIHQALQNAKNA